MPPLELVVDNPSVAAVTERALTWPERARQIQVIDADSYTAAAELLKGIKALRGEVDATFDPIVKAAFESHRTAVAQKRKAETPLSEAEGIIKAALTTYQQEQQRLADARRREEERLAREEAERLALEQAAAMELEGRQYGDEALVQEAHDLIEHPIVAAPCAPAPRPTPAVAGISHRTTYSAEVTSLALLVQHIAKHQNLLPLLKVDQAALNGQARSLRESLTLPGVRLVKVNTVAAGSR